MLDDTEEKELQKRIRELEWQVTALEHDLIHDPLTGLKTRAYFEEQIRPYLEAIRKAKQFGESPRREQFGFSTLSILFFDIDKFKSINDTHGHAKGDLVLRRVAEAIKRSVRADDTVARWGGEEMVVALLGASEDGASAKAGDIREAIDELEFPEVPSLKVTISVGVAAFTEDVTLESLVKRADEALYKAKQTGRNKVVRYSEFNI